MRKARKCHARRADHTAMDRHQEPQPRREAKAPIRSSFSDDPEMRELVDYFLGDLTRRVESLRSALDADDALVLRRLAHQLAGAAAGYGFAEIGDAAHEVDDGLAHEMLVSDVRERAEDLIALCRRAIPAVSADPCDGGGR
jgi:HPt (histidine-containing phosphotransfer) domain-containing protein